MEDEYAKSCYKNHSIDKVLEVGFSSQEIGKYLKSEIKFLDQVITENSLVVDFGCGNGRHLRNLEKKLEYGLGLDYLASHIEVANHKTKSNKIDYQIADITKYRAEQLYDFVICMYNTIGNIDYPKKAIESMNKSCKSSGKIIVSVFSEFSIPARVKMYTDLNDAPLIIGQNYIQINSGFKSYHFTEEELTNIAPQANIIKCGDIGWIATWSPTSTDIS